MQNHPKVYFSKRNNGIWYYAIKDNTDKIYWKSTQCRLKSGAIQFVKSLMIQQNPKEENNIPLFSSFVKSYLDTKKIDLRKGTIELVEYSVEQFLKRLPDKIITEYTVEDMEQFKQKGLQDKLSPTTVNIYFRNIRTLFRHAFKKNLIKNDIGETVKQIKTPEKNPKFMNKEELNQLLSAVKRNKTMHDLFLVCSLTGMRCSEAINLQWDAVDFSNRVINVKNTETFTTKTGKERTIPMHEKVVEVLKSRYNPERKYVFNKPGNTVPYSRNYIAHKFKIAVRKAKLPEYLHFHCTRHSCASFLVNAGVSLYEVQKILGHADIETTQIYAHLEQNTLANSIAKINF